MSNERVVGKTSEIPPGTAKSFKEGGATFAVFNIEGTFYAIEDTCSHVGAPLSEGTLDGEVVICPWHGAKFNVRTGEVLAPPAPRNVGCFPVRIEGTNIVVTLSQGD